jgi:lactate dehydrogenase-like 2-hydroxyacid dehydrogenase
LQAVLLADGATYKRVSASVKVIATYSVGYDHIDLRAAAERKIAIAYTPLVETDAVADIAMLLLLGASKRAYEAQELVRTLQRCLDGNPPGKFSASSAWDR